MGVFDNILSILIRVLYSYIYTVFSKIGKLQFVNPFLQTSPAIHSIPLPYQICTRAWDCSSIYVIYIYKIAVSHLTFQSIIYYSITFGPTTPILVQSDIAGPHDHQDDCGHHLGSARQEQQMLVCWMWMVNWGIMSIQKQSKTKTHWEL